MMAPTARETREAVAAPDVLGRNDRAARRQRRKQRDEQKVDGVHKGDAGNRRFAAGGDHYGIRHTDGYGQKLLNNKGYDELPQIFVWKHVFASFQYFGQSIRFFGKKAHAE